MKYKCDKCKKETGTQYAKKTKERGKVIKVEWLCEACAKLKGLI